MRDNENYEDWLLYLLKGVEITALDTIRIINEIRELMQDYKSRIREGYKFYSQDLLNNLFCHPYTKIEFIEEDLKVSRQTAAKYLDTLAEDGFLQKEKIGFNNYYINKPLFDIFIQ